MLNLATIFIGLFVFMYSPFQQRKSRSPIASNLLFRDYGGYNSYFSMTSNPNLLGPEKLIAVL